MFHIYIFLLCLRLTVWICKIFFIHVFYNMILYFNSFIFGTWRYHKQLKFCLRIIITLIKKKVQCKNKNKVVLFKKKIIVNKTRGSVSFTFHSALRKLNTESSIGASHQISVHFGKAVSEKKIFRNRPI